MQTWTNVGPPEVLVGFGSPRTQRRLTVAFRLILLVPHFIVALFIGLATDVVAIVGWFCALILGRLPRGIQEFLTGSVRYFLRLGAYAHLLNDVYPPFYLRPAPYPADVFVTPGRLNRFAVFFRMILVIPAAIVAIVVGSGTSVILFFAWIITLVSGRLPSSLHQALAACLRYQVRYYAYLGLVTAAYPRGLFGDDSARIAQANMSFDQWAWDQTAAVPEPATPPVPASPLPQYPPSAPAEYPPEYAPVAPPPYPPAPPQQFSPYADVRTGEPLATRLVLDKAAKRIVVLIIVIGVLSQVGSAIAQASLGNLGTSSNLSSDYSELSGAVATFQNQMSTCRSENSFPCVQSAALQLSGAFSTFSNQVLDLNVPSSDQSDATNLSSVARSVANDAAQMGSAPSPAAYQAAAQRFRSDATSFDAAYRTLVTDLG